MLPKNRLLGEFFVDKCKTRESNLGLQKLRGTDDVRTWFWENLPITYGSIILKKPSLTSLTINVPSRSVNSALT